METEMTRRKLLQAGAALGATLVSSRYADVAAAAGRVKPHYGGHLVVGLDGAGASQASLDPLASVGAKSDIMRYENVFEGLTRLQLSAQPPAPGAPLKTDLVLATSFEPVSKDQTTWIVRIRQGVEFHNGQPLTADDVVYTLNRALDPTRSVGLIFGAWLDKNGITEVDSRTVKLKLVHPRSEADLRAFLSNKLLGIVQKDTTNFNPPIGTGPFKFVEWTPGQRTLLAKNTNYWINGRPYLDQVEVLDFADAVARHNALLGGQIQVESPLDVLNAKSMSRNSRFKVLRTPADQAYPFVMRTDRKPFSDARVRLAFKLAVDRPKMLQLAFSGFGRVGNDLFGESWEFYDHKLPQHSYDPVRARALLKAAGYPRGLDVDLPVPPGIQARIAQIFQEQAKASGIKVHIRVVPLDTYYSTWVRGDEKSQTAFGMSYWGTHTGEIAQYMAAKSPYDEVAWRQSAGPRWWHTYEKVQNTPDPAQARPLWNALQRDWWARGGYIVWGLGDALDAYTSQLHGVVPAPTGGGFFGAPLGGYSARDWWLS